MLEIELKFAVADFDPLREKLRRLEQFMDSVNREGFP